MRRIVPVLVAGLLVVAFAAPASASYTLTWHRDNYGNEHQRLVCTITSGVWQCRQEVVVPSSQQGNQNQGNGTTGAALFRGSSQVGDCPSWAADEYKDVCAHASSSMVVGALTYNSPFTVWEEMIFTDRSDGLAPMYVYLAGPLVPGFYTAVCPWYPTWQEALTNPHDCFFPA